MATFDRIAFFRACENGQLGECKRLVSCYQQQFSVAPNRSIDETFPTPHNSMLPKNIYAFPILNLPRRRQEEYDDESSNDYGRKECPPLHAAAWNGHTDVVRYLLGDCGVDVNEAVRMADSSDWFQTALFRACEAATTTNCHNTNRKTCCQVLLEAGADLWCCASLAVWKGDAPLLKLLTDYGANPEIGYPHRTNRECPPLHIAISQCRPDVLEILFENKCTFLKNGSLVPSLVEMMQKKKNVNNQSAESDHRATVRVFQLIIQNIPRQLVQGALLDLLRPSGSALASQENRLIVEKLLKAGANSSEPLLAFLGRVQGRHYDQRYLETVHFLIDNGAHPGDGFERCFHHALSIADEKLMSWILKHWDTQFGNSRGYQPIHMACCYPQLKVKSLEFLLKHRPDSLELAHGTTGNGGLLPIEIACQWDLDLDVVYTLLRHKPSLLLEPQSRSFQRDASSSLRPTKRRKR